MFGFDIRRAELACLVAREKDHAPRLLCVAFEHTLPFEPSPPRIEPVEGRGLRMTITVATAALDCDGEDWLPCDSATPSELLLVYPLGAGNETEARRQEL